MTNYPFYHNILSFLDCPLILFKHCSISSGWRIVECLYVVVQNQVKVALVQCEFFSITMMR